MSSLVDLEAVDNAFEVRGKLPQPVWTTIREYIECKVARNCLYAAWTEAAEQWLDRLRTAWGGVHQIDSSKNFLLLSESDEIEARQVLGFAERALTAIRLRLGEAAIQEWHGPFVVLWLRSLEHFLDYGESTFGEAMRPTVGAYFSNLGYGHIVIGAPSLRSAVVCLAHELSHANVQHLPLPRWLDEGIACVIGADCTGHSMVTNRTQILRNQICWRRWGLRAFWSGITIELPRRSVVRNTYVLAELLVRRIIDESPHRFVEFVLAAHESDAGAGAARAILKKELTQYAFEILGIGDWSLPVEACAPPGKEWRIISSSGEPDSLGNLAKH